jgi:hypothetical protein
VERRRDELGAPGARRCRQPSMREVDKREQRVVSFTGRWHCNFADDHKASVIFLKLCASGLRAKIEPVTDAYL